ncbi:hypothetical protein Tco_0385632 [Tanacetum coccineum]
MWKVMERYFTFWGWKFSRIPFGVTPKVLLVAWERFSEIKDALTDKKYRQEDIQELMSKLLEDVQNISEELSEYINLLRTLSQSQVSLRVFPKIRVMWPFVDSSIFDALSDHSEILSDSNNDDTSSDDNDFEDIEYVSLEEVNDVDQEEKEFDLEDILQIQDVILREKLLNVHRLITNIESLNDNPTPDRVFKSPSSVPIPVTDSDSLFKESDSSLSHLDNSLPEFEPIRQSTEETRMWQYH